MKNGVLLPSFTFGFTSIRRGFPGIGQASDAHGVQARRFEVKRQGHRQRQTVLSTF